MKKGIRNVVIGATCATMLFAMTGCVDPEMEHFEAESRPVAIAIGALDENFNPFFYTSGNDGDVISMTQISMLTADADGNIVCGENQATMALDYSVTSYDEEEQPASGDAIDHTTYEFLIKKGVKDSTGHDMGILDVLFNLYVYLDPVYSGSSTIYSTNIKGLKAYRTQQPGLSDDSSVDVEGEYRAAAQQRISDIISYDTEPTPAKWENVKDDVQLVAKIFREGLEKDWTSVVGTVSSYDKEFRFTEDWEVYMWNEGIADYQYTKNALQNNERLKDEKGRFYTTLEAPHEDAIPGTADQTYIRTRYIEPAVDGLTGTAKDEAMKNASVQFVFSNYLGGTEGSYQGLFSGALSQVIGSSFSADILTAFIRDEMSKDSAGSDGLKVNSVSGITTDKVTSFKGKDLGGTYDLLRIVINKVDPAAIYNFAFTVAPMHYYSGWFNGVDYVKFAEDNWENDKVDNRFGVVYKNTEFMDNVIGGSDKEIPVGAGAYKKNESESKFWDLSMVRYERNEYFETLGSGIENAKIKYLNYVYTTDDTMLDKLKNGNIDYGQPQCTPTNVQQISDIKHLNMRNYAANGFGYVGINPTYVPDREVRVAIMLAMNPQNYIVDGYYTTQYSEPIYRPTSSTNFLKNYNNDNGKALSTPYVFNTGVFDEDGEIGNVKLEWTATQGGSEKSVIEKLVESAGWQKPNGKYEKGGKRLSLTFTIAGESTDHPAMQMFREAANQLNALGFDINVKNDQQALISLATGKLAVWAAAWSTGIDPDMYQIYHKDSTASSTRNWGYSTIMSNTTLYAEENTLLDHLSHEIDQARSYTQENVRAGYYISALNDVMELAIELPTYQRHDLAVYNNKVIKYSSLNQKPSANAGPLYKIWELDYN